MSQSSSDPLPFIQIDRAVEPTAALLSGHLKVTHQHAIGSLYEFWKLCGDVRELERIVVETPPGIEPELVLTPEDVQLRFELASGIKAEPIVLARLGILEVRGDSFRVRGMSRLFDPIASRLQSRRAASEGGKASAKRRAEMFGTSQPRSAVASTVAQADIEAIPKRRRSGAEAEAEASPKPDRSLEVIGHRSETIKEARVAEAAPPIPLELKIQTTKARALEKPVDPVAELQRFVAAASPEAKEVFRTLETVRGLEINPDWKLLRFIEGKLKTEPADRLCAAIRGHWLDAWQRANQPSLYALFRESTVIAQWASKGAA